MSDPAFLAGLVFGLIASALSVMIYTKLRRRPARREPIDWEERTYAPPVATTTVTINKRSFDL